MMTKKTIICLSLYIVLIIVFYLPIFLYYKLGWFHKWFHDILGWHVPIDPIMYNDGCSMHSECKYCHKDIMQDSQGNWFQ